MNVLVILRGLPGAGKTSLAKVLGGSTAPVYSIDDYFTDPVTGKYEFRYAENHLAYKQCAENTGSAMRADTPLILLDNAFTIEWEMEPYFKLAAQYNYRVYVVTVEKRHNGRNIHAVSDEQLRKMAEKYKVVLY